MTSATSTFVRGDGTPPPAARVTSYNGDGRWNDQHFGQRPDAKHRAGWRYCCYPDCSWLVPVEVTCCLYHGTLVPQKRLDEVRALAARGEAEQPFDYDIAADMLAAEMVESAAQGMF